MEKQIELIPLAEIGHGRAKVTDNIVEIEVSGISGGMKAWLIGGEAVPIGNIVDGRLRKSVDTTGHTGILITQTGRQMLIGTYKEDDKEVTEQKEEIKETDILTENEVAPFEIGNFNWRKFTEKSFEGISRELRFILSNKSVYDNYKKHRHYWVGESDKSGALALKCEDAEVDPLDFLGETKLKRNGYIIVCVDKETNRLYIPD